MGAFLIKQKNGRYSRYSTIVDDITDYDMTEEEYIQYQIDKAAKEAEETAKWVIKNNCYNIDYVKKELIDLSCEECNKDLKELIEKGVF